jgi:hypothetical protein
VGSRLGETAHGTYQNEQGVLFMKSPDQKQNGRMEIVVIGPEPPCVRCLNLFKFAKEAAAQFPKEIIEVRKIFSHSDEAARYGRIEGGHTIAEREQVKADGNILRKLMGEVSALEAGERKHEGLIESKLGEIDQVLMPVRQKAEEVGSLMTPVLVINGKVKSKGYVPRREQIREWIASEPRRD